MFFLELLYFFLPGYLANGSPPVWAKLPLLRRWKTPVDFGRSWRGARLLGENKSLRGVVLGTLLGGLFFLAQKYLFVSAIATPSIPYDVLPWWFGFLLGFGAIFVGDCGKSFLKRRIGVKPGKPWIPFDQFDYTLGAFALTFWLFWPGWAGFLFLLVVNGLASVVAHYAAGMLKLTKERL